MTFDEWFTEYLYLIRINGEDEDEYEYYYIDMRAAFEAGGENKKADILALINKDRSPEMQALAKQIEELE